MHYVGRIQGKAKIESKTFRVTSVSKQELQRFLCDHAAFTQIQRDLTKGMQPGDTRVLDFP